MLNRFIKTISSVIPVAIALFLPGFATAQYRVSGVVEFTYRSLETKSGGSVTSDHYWTQLYRANMQGNMWDPRFMRFSAGVGYSVISFKSGSDSKNLDYNLTTTFFPGMKLSWDLFGYKNVLSAESTANIAGYDVTTTSYGGTVRLNLNANGNDRFNNTNNTNGKRYPDIILSRVHTESESQSASNPLNETRDNTRASINYQTNSAFTLGLDGSIEEYTNKLKNASYDTKTANLTSNIRLSPLADLSLTGRVSDRGTVGIPGYDSSETVQEYNALLNFKERDGLRHYYRYNYIDRRTSTTELATHTGEARVLYKIKDEWRIQGGLDYRLSDFVRDPNLQVANDIGEKSSLESGGVLTGVMYRKKYAPAFLGSFVFDTGYDFTSGFSKLTSETGGPEGSGWYYTNNVTAGLASEKWEKENLSLSYNFNNKRDGSPLNNDTWQHTYRFALATTRIPRTSIRSSVSYISQSYTSEAGAEFLPVSAFTSQQAGTNQQRRTFSYDVNADHTVSSYLTLAAGAQRGQTTATTFTLSTLTPAGTTITEDVILYVSANFTYPITRNLLYRALLREEYRSTLAVDIRSSEVRMYLDYRIRQIFFNVEYRLREDIPEEGTRTVQQYYYATLSRPF